MLPDTVYDLTLTGQQGDRELTTHPVAVETPTGLLLIDTGLPGQTDDLVDALAAAGADLGDVAGVVLTHQDPDHAGCLVALRERAADARGTPPTVYAHVADAPYVDGRAKPIKSDGDRYPPVAVDVELVGGTVFRTDAGPMRVVETPGHTPGHVAYVSETLSVAFVGDLVRESGGDLGPSPKPMSYDTERVRDSIEYLADAEPAVEVLAMGHGVPFVRNGAVRLAELGERIARL